MEKENSTLHFAFVLYRYFPHGGLQRDFLRTLQEALNRGHRVSVFLARQEAPLPENAGLEVMLLPVSGFSNHARMISFSKAVKQKLAEHKFDNVLMFSRIPGGDFYFAADNCLAADWGQNRNALVLHLPRYRTFLKLEQEIFSPESRTEIFALVPRQVQEYQTFYHTQKERFSILPPGIDSAFRRPENIREIRQQIRRELNISDDAVVLIQVAAQFEVKGTDRAIAALAALPEEKRRSCILLVVGGGKIGNFQKLAVRAGVEKNVIFTGARSDVAALIAASICFSLGPACHTSVKALLSLPTVMSDVPPLANSSEEQLRKAMSPIKERFLPNVTLFRQRQSAKAELPMLLRPLGSATLSKLVQSENASSPILVIPSWMITVFTEVFTSCQGVLS